MIASLWPYLLGLLASPLLYSLLQRNGSLAKFQIALLKTAEPLGDMISRVGTAHKYVQIIYVPFEVFLFDTLCQYAELMRKGALKDNPEMQLRDEVTKISLTPAQQIEKALKENAEQKLKE